MPLAMGLMMDDGWSIFLKSDAAGLRGFSGLLVQVKRRSRTGGMSRLRGNAASILDEAERNKWAAVGE